jgi:FkbM family methyltransferase
MLFYMHGKSDFDKSLNDVIRFNPLLTIIDVGANRGDFLKTAIKNGHKGSYLAIEPIEQLAVHLQENFADRNQNVKVLNVAVSTGETRNQKFNLYPERPELSSIYTLTDEARDRYKITQSKTINIQTVSINTLIARERAPIFLKLDTQGFDYKILEDISAETVGLVSFLLIEVPVNNIYSDANTWLEYLTLVHELGFEPSAFHVVSRHDSCLVEFDLLAKKAKR